MNEANYAFMVGIVVGGVFAFFTAVVTFVVPLFFFYKAWEVYYSTVVENLGEHAKLTYENMLQMIGMKAEHKMYTSQGEDDNGEEDDDDDEVPRKY